MLGITLRIMQQGAGFDEAGGGSRRTPGDQQSPGSASDGDGDCSRGKRRKKNIGEDTRYLRNHIQGLTKSISNHGENARQRGERMVGQVGRDGNVSVAAGGALQSNGNAEFQALEVMETRIKAIALLKRSYAQVFDAETETGGGDNPCTLRRSRRTIKSRKHLNALLDLYRISSVHSR